MKLVQRFCSVCGGVSEKNYVEGNFKQQHLNQFSFASRKEPEDFHLSFYLCERCDLLYVNRALSNEVTDVQYEAASFDSSIEAGYAAKTYAKYLPQKSAIKSALDIGTGGGEFLLELHKAGVENICGIEPSQAAINTADDKIRPFIKKGFFSKEVCAGQKFDLISCFQTFEHVFDPLQVGRDAYSLLNDGGRFFVIAHNFRGRVNQILGKKSPIYDIEHLQLFSPKSLQKVLEKAGFKEVEVFSIINTYPLFYWVKLFPKIPCKKLLMQFLKKIKIGYLPISLPIGNLAAIAKK